MKKNLLRKNMVLGIIILLVGASIIPGISSDKTAFGKTIIVDDDAIDDPVNHTWNTINKGLNDAQDGDEIWVYNGTYDENLVIEKHVKLIAQMTDLFGNDINGAFVVGAGNADVIKIIATMVEISGFTIQESGSIYAGIRTESSYNEISKNTLLLNGYGIVCSGTNTISENRIMANFNGGILLTSFEDSMIVDNKITGNGGNGLTLQSSDNNIISENIIQANQGNGILFSHISGENDVFENNISYNVENGVEIWYASKDNTLYDNIIMNNTGDGIHINHSTSIQPANTIIEKNFISNNSGFGIYLLHSKDNKISENKIVANDNDGIYLKYSNSTEISGNFITNNDDGIHQFSSRWNKITSNNITKNTKGINLDSSIDTTVSSNNITKNTKGINLDSSIDTTVSSNNITKNTNGVYLYSSTGNSINLNNISKNTFGIDLSPESDGNTLSRNNISNSDVHAIKLHYSKDNTIVNNNITNTNGTGVYIQTGSDNNKFYHNNFINNTIQAYDAGNNIWNNIYPCGGNYWDNYDEEKEGAFDNKSGPDQNEPNSDGICDLPYSISGDSNQDRYPFISPDGWLTYLIPDLESEGTLDWRNVKPGETVTDSFTVENIGDSCSLLDWKIIEWPSWGNWTFNPEEGDDLTPEDGAIKVQVSVIAPNEQNQAFSGNIKIINRHDNNDYCTIQVSLATPKNKAINSLFLDFLENHLYMFPLLQHLLGL